MIEASTIAPIATAMPPSDMMFAVSPWADIGRKAEQHADRASRGSESGRCGSAAGTARITDRDDRQLLDQRPAQRARSRRGSAPSGRRSTTISTPSGSEGCELARAAPSRASMTRSAFSPQRITTMPPTTSPRAVELGEAAAQVRSEARRGATSSRRTGVPRSRRHAAEPGARSLEARRRSRARGSCTRGRRARGSAAASSFDSPHARDRPRRARCRSARGGSGRSRPGTAGRSRRRTRPPPRPARSAAQ